MVGVAHGEGVGQRRLEGDVVAGVGAQSQAALGGQPLIHAAVIPCALCIVPGVRRDVAHRRVAGILRAQRIGAAACLAIRLRQHVAGRRGRRVRVRETAHAGQRAEIMVERPVLLHQDADMPHVVKRTGLAVWGNRQRARDGRRRIRGMGQARFFSHDSINTANNVRILSAAGTAVLMMCGQSLKTRSPSLARGFGGARRMPSGMVGDADQAEGGT
ncbi:hypothetical protein G6F62_013792 [Rhizopus arrhizus]|nr:hypothetical protein G6F62_013792 [Rhizopus arrhizus]